jgi:hypothetical protein
MPNCTKCGSPYNDDGKYWECLNPVCGHSIKKELYTLNSRHWLTKIAENKELWHQAIFDAKLPIISSEYQRLFKLCKEKQSYGVLLEIKDMFEILIKFPSLLTAASIYQKTGYSDAEAKLLITMLEKQLLLGTWKNVSNTAKSLATNPQIKSWLMAIDSIFDKHEIVSWRNSQIGHGALSLEEDKDFQDDIIEKIGILNDFLNLNSSNLSELNTKIIYDLINTSIYFKKDDKDYVHFFDS